MHDVWWKRSEAVVDRETVQYALAFIMGVDDKLNEILDLLRDEDDEAESEP